MKHRVWALLCLLSAAAARPAEAQSGAGAVARFAVVIGNNQPETTQGSVLRYADDDAVATHRLLVEAGVDSTLLVRLDDDSRALYPNIGEHGRARSQELDRAFERAFTNIRKSTESGRRAELLIFYSGHGDVDQGEGYVVLE
ncbi:MAG TPA: caspase family protein, partial [Polyangiaceae bacterium]|nr:caspase family protein [Polyangiaceae bacterium]